jgi:hypothetical protein
MKMARITDLVAEISTWDLPDSNEDRGVQYALHQ